MKIGFIGCGNMGSAMMMAIKKNIPTSTITIFDFDATKMNKEGFVQATSEIDVVVQSDYIFLATKPQSYTSLLQTISSQITHQVILLMAPGYSIEKVESIIGKKKIVRSMPNTAALVSEAMSAVVFNEEVNNQEQQDVLALYKTFGDVEVIQEKDLDIFGAISGCLPAFVDLFLESLADSAVAYGLSRDAAYRIVAQATLGSATLAKETKMAPAVLKDQVCSSGGTTIQGVIALEKHGFRNSVHEAIKAVMIKTKEMKQ